jgi:NTE family protein
MRRSLFVDLNHLAITAVAMAVLTAGVTHATAQAPPQTPRPRVGVAFGGGSARGLAHVGVLRWFEEHHVPIDLAAGTSMGGLIGGGFASGMSSDELTALLERTDWDEMFGFSPFRYKNIRRKEDARVYPSRLELGWKKGLSLPLALNNGQQVDFLLARIAAPYGMLATFDDLPTPFRAVAVDLVSAQEVVLDRGGLTEAMRATMSLPGIFPPVERDAQVLVDGGALNNVPADVVRAMGADVVVAVNVSSTADPREVSRSLFGLMSQSIDVMMQANTRDTLKSADIVMVPALEKFGSLDWRRSRELIEVGYAAAESMKERLLPLAVSDTEWAAYQERRRARRKTALPVPAFITVAGTVAADQAQVEKALAARVGQPLDIDGLETDLEALTGLDRYETVGWRIDERGDQRGIRVDARPKAHAPPFLMIGINLQNTTRDDFAFQLAARYLKFDVAGSGSELRIDGAVGAQPNIGLELYRPIGSPFFVTGSAGASRETVSFIEDDIIVARYSESRALIGAGVGVNLGRRSDVRLGFTYGDLDASVQSGTPDLPELHGAESRMRLAWRRDGQDSPVVPSSGSRYVASLEHLFKSPAPPPEFVTDRSNDGVTIGEVRASSFWSYRDRHRLFVNGGAGTAWGHPLANEQFQLGSPMRLGAYGTGELRGDHYAVLTGGYLHGIRRLPDFLGGPIYLGGWVENGSVFDDVDDAKFRTNVSLGVIADTLVGPVVVGSSFGFNGAWRYYVGIGRLF